MSKKYTFGFVYTAFCAYENCVKTKNEHLYFSKACGTVLLGTHAHEKRFVLIIGRCEDDSTGLPVIHSSLLIPKQKAPKKK